MTGCIALSLLYLLFAAVMSKIPLQLSVFTGLIPFQEIPTMMRYFHLHAAHVRFNNLLLSLSPILLHPERGEVGEKEEGVGPSLCLSPSKRAGWDQSSG